MVNKLNRTITETKPDTLIYDSTHPLNGSVVYVSALKNEKGGVLERGQVLDLHNDKYTIHGEGGTPNVIVAESTDYAAGDTEISVPVYITGSFRRSALISGVDITSTDIEALRGVGIIVK